MTDTMNLHSHEVKPVSVDKNVGFAPLSGPLCVRTAVHFRTSQGRESGDFEVVRSVGVRPKTVVSNRQSFHTGPASTTTRELRKTAVADQSDKQPAGKGSKRVQQLGDYELKKKLGKGGMGEVFLARQISLDRLVALKTLSKELSKREDFVQRFHREAKSMARLDHPNVVKVYAVDTFKGLSFVAIEYIDGQSVQAWLDKLKRLEIGDAVHIALVCAEALRHAHDLNMVHRDIKPDNILITSKGVVKVADFGLAKAMDEDVSMTQSGTGLGTPLYMAPEQARDAKRVDQRSDIYALGSTLYHMLTGKLPFNGTSTLELIISKEKGTYPSARSVRSEIPERLDLVIDKMMAKDPAHRYKNCEDLIRDLSAVSAHNETLSFIEGGEPVALVRTGGPTVVGALGSTAGGVGAETSASARRAAQKSAAKAGAGGGSAATPSRVWFVQYEDINGKIVVEKHTTGRILKMIAAGVITAKAKGKASSDGTYLPLAQFQEFTDAIENQLARRTAAVRKEDMGSLYARVAKAEANRHKWRSAKNVFSGLVGWTSLIIWVGGILVVAWLAFMYGGQLVKQAASSLGFSPETTTSAPADNSTGNTALELPE